MIRFGLLAVVSTLAIAMSGEATSTECPTIGVDLGIIDVDLVEGEPTESVEGEDVDTYCISQRQSKVPWTAQRNHEVSEIQFRKTNESSLLRYVWDMIYDAENVPTNFKKFVVVAVSQTPPTLTSAHDPKPYPATVCQRGFNLGYRYIARALCDNDLSLIIVAANDQMKSAWGSWADTINVEYPDCHDIQVTSVSPDRPENLSDARQEEPVAATYEEGVMEGETSSGLSVSVPASGVSGEDARQEGSVVETYKGRVMEAVKLEIYRQLTSSTSSTRDKFPRCSFIRMFPSTQILNVWVNPPNNHQRVGPIRDEENNFYVRNVETECYVYQRIEPGSWRNQNVGWQSQSITTYSLYRVVYEFSLGRGEFTSGSERAMVINIPDQRTLLPAPEHDIDGDYLEGLPGSFRPKICEWGFEYTWDHFFYGLWHDSLVVVVLVPWTEPQRDILEAVRDQIKDEQMKKRMLIAPSQCGACLGELYEYYRVLFPVSYGTCRADLSITSTASVAEEEIIQPTNTMTMSEEDRECPTIGVDLGIIDVDLVEGEPTQSVEGEDMDTYCISQRQSKVPWTAQRNREVSEIQFRKTNESSLLRYVWDMIYVAVNKRTNFKKFVAVAVSQGPPNLTDSNDPPRWPTLVCDPGFSLNYRYIARALCEYDLPLIIVAANDQMKSAWGSWADTINVEYPDCHDIQVTSVSPDHPENLSDARQEEPVAATYEERVMEAVKLEIYKQLTSSTSSTRDKFPRCSFIPLCPGTQILNAVVYPGPIYRHGIVKYTNDSITGVVRHVLQTECYVDQRNEIGMWTNQELGWQSKSIRDYSLYRVVLNYSGALEGEVGAEGEGIVRFLGHAERAIVINIPRAYILLPAPEHDIDEGYLEGRVETIEPSFICKDRFEYTWDHFFYGLWHDSRMVVVLVPETEAQQEILEAVRSKLVDEQMKKRMIIQPPLVYQHPLDELYEYYRVLFPVSYGTCRPELLA